MCGCGSKPLVLLVWTLLSACQREQDPARSEPAPPASFQPIAIDATPGTDAAPSSSALAALRSALELPPRDAPPQHIAFGKGRLAQLERDQLVVRATGDFAVVARVPVRDPRAVAELADGSLVVADADALYHLAPEAEAPKRYPRIVFFPGSVVLADRKQAKNFWLFHTLTFSLYHHALEESESALLAFGDAVELGSIVRGGFTAMKDGSFLYASEDKLSRVFPKGKPTTFKLPRRDATIQRLLTTRRIDQAWAVWSSGLIELMQVAPQFRPVRSWKLPSNVYDIASNDRYIALLLWERRPSGPRRWSLAVSDDKGQEQFSVELPSEPSAGAGSDWVEAVTRDKTLALSSREPLLAVGGPGSVTVWQIETKKALFSGDN